MSSLHELGRLVAKEQDALRASTSLRAKARERVAGYEPAAEARLGRARGAWLLAAGLAAAAVGIAYFVQTRAPRDAHSALTLHAGDSPRPVRAGAFLEAPAQAAPLGLRLSDGTRVTLAPRTRARVVELDPNGAHLSLESGHAHVAVRHRPSTSYRLSVGPFLVRVIGTRFDVSWDPERDVLRVELAEGRVQLSGCVFGTSYVLSPGQSVEASCKRGSIQTGGRSSAALPMRASAEASPQAVDTQAVDTQAVDTQAVGTQAVDTQPADTQAIAEPQSPSPAPEARSPVRQAHPAVTETAARADAAKPERAADWRALARRGAYEAAFARVADAFAREAERASAKDLALLADVARYAGEPDREAEALLLMRKRFFGTSRAALAAFALGRLELDGAGDPAKAAEWLDTYLQERPAGPLAREAEGRLIEAALALGDRAVARARASEYLQKHPSGPHARLCRKLLGEPRE